MGLQTPLVTYNSIKIGTTDIALSSTGRVSFNSPFNTINIKFTPTNCSLSYYEVRITPENSTYDIGEGLLIYSASSIAANQQYSFSITLTEELLTPSGGTRLPDGTYRIGLYARSAIDGSWDMTYLYFTAKNTSSEQFNLSSNDPLRVLTTKNS